MERNEMLVLIESTDRKSIKESECWSSDKSKLPKDELTEIGFTEEEYKNLPDILEMTSETIYSCGEVTVDMSEKDFNETDWENNREWNPYGHEYEVEDFEYSNGSNDFDFDFDIGEEVDSYAMYELILDYGDINDGETIFFNSLKTTKI